MIVAVLIGCSTVSDDISSEYYNIGNAYYDVGNYEKAIEYYIEALSEDHPSVNKIRFNLAVAYSESGRMDEGVEQFEILLEEDSQNFIVLQSLAYAKYLAGFMEESLDLYDEILSVFEFEPTALYNKSLILIENKQVDEARIVLEKLYEVDQSVEVVLKLGSIYKDSGDWDSLIRIYEMSLVGDVQDQKVLSDLIEYYEDEKQFYKAIEFIDLLLSQKDLDEKAEYQFRKSSIQLLELNDFKEGFALMKESVESGFSDTARIKQLVEAEGFVQADLLKDYFSLRNLY